MMRGWQWFHSRTLKALEEMKDTLLKALLPTTWVTKAYTKRVSIVDGQGSVRSSSSPKQPEGKRFGPRVSDQANHYHLPNFNRKPEDNYMDDLKSLRNGLNDLIGLGGSCSSGRGRGLGSSGIRWQGEVIWANPAKPETVLLAGKCGSYS